MRKWLNDWRGLGDVVTGVNRQSFMPHLSKVDASTWRATFSREVMLSSDGFGAGATPWRAVRVAAWDALTKKSPASMNAGYSRWRMSSSRDRTALANGILGRRMGGLGYFPGRKSPVTTMRIALQRILKSDQIDRR